MASRVGRYLLLETLGTGSFGKVKLGVHEETGERVAVKIMDKGSIKEHEMATNVRREIAIMKALEHRNIVNLRQVLTSANKLYIVMDLVTGGELFTKIYKHGALPEPLARKYFQELVDGVSYCHSKGVYHRDLKPENLLIDEATGSLKITDFGLSTMVGINSADEMLHTMCGSPNYCAPEIIGRSKEGYSGAKVDSWACGIVLFALLTGYLPFFDENQKNLYRMICTQHVRFPRTFPEDAKDLVNRLLNKNPRDRMVVEDVKKHPWFTRGYVPDVKAVIRAATTEQPRQYNFRAAAARERTALTIKNGLPRRDYSVAATALSGTAVGDKVQRIDDFISRYRVLFGLRVENMQLPREMKAVDDASARLPVSALVRTEEAVLALHLQMLTVLDGDHSALLVSDAQLASLEELLGIFGLHGQLSNAHWWKSVGSSPDERKRVFTLMSRISGGANTDALTNGFASGKEAPNVNAATGAAAKPAAASVALPPPAPPMPVAPAVTDHTRPNAATRTPVEGRADVYAPKRAAPAVAAAPPAAAPPPPSTGAAKPPGGSTAAVVHQVPNRLEFEVHFPATKCILLVGRILVKLKCRVMMKKGETKLKSELATANGEMLRVGIVATESNGVTRIALKKSSNDTTRGEAEITQLYSNLYEHFCADIAKVLRQ